MKRPAPSVKQFKRALLDRLCLVGSVVRDTGYGKVTMSDSISVTSQCYDCMLSDSLCSECQDLAEARASDIAHQIVDDRADTYRYAPMYTPLLKVEPEPSGHDWVSSVTYLQRPAIQLDGSIREFREEFKASASSISDRFAQSWFLGKHIFDMTVEDEDLEFSSLYEVCTQCYLLKNKAVVCPNCA